jgi:N-acetylneuraminic acid mutarotase
VVTVAIPAASGAPGLTFEDRVQAQEAIERLYHGFRDGSNRSFEESVPRAVIESRVRTYLKRSMALETIWGTAVTTEMLDRELERMAVSTRMPDRLLEIFRILDNDPRLIRECLARPALVGRLARNFFDNDRSLHAGSRRIAESLHDELVQGAIDPFVDHPRRTEWTITDAMEGSGPADRRGRRLSVPAAELNAWRGRLPRDAGEVSPVTETRHGFLLQVKLEDRPGRLRAARYFVPKRTWDEWWRQVEPELDEYAVETVGSIGNPLPTSTAFPPPCLPDDTWDNGSLDDVPEPRTAHTAIWTGTHMIIWGGLAGDLLDSGYLYDPATDTWASVSPTGAPTARRHHTAVWAGNRMVVWGGRDAAGTLATGGRYDPVFDSWDPINGTGAPGVREFHSAVSTGDRMIVWGGWDGINLLATGADYDPVNDLWSTLPTTGAPERRQKHTAVWTGDRMVVWGGLGSTAALASGGEFDPAGGGTWTSTPTTGVPAPRNGHAAVWAGNRMVVWGGRDGSTVFGTGGRYTPSTATADGSWESISPTGAPAARELHTAVWTGTHVVVWGGHDGSSYLSTGGRYLPGGDTWLGLDAAGAPSGRTGHSAVWADPIVVVWGGRDGSFNLNSGGRYDPAGDSWTPTATANGPVGRWNHNAVWTGAEMLVWGGANDAGLLDSGDRYDPATDSWTMASTVNAPAARENATTVWTGDWMIVWGGDGGGGSLDSGSRYDPSSDVWASTTLTGAPSPRRDHTAVWSGDRMIVWGGVEGSFYSYTGGRYDPETDVWQSTSLTGVPFGRAQHTAVWTGSEMMIWGGYNPFAGGYQYTGGRYDPGTDGWTPMTTAGAPGGRAMHTAVWTGTAMIVWGGQSSTGPLDDGGRFDAGTGTWSALGLTAAPQARWEHTAAWTGARMIVWGGRSDGTSLGSGGRYDPATGGWMATAATEAPSARHFHTAVWTGTYMLVWGGVEGADTGGRYALEHAVDLDGDGFSSCDGDCLPLHPGAYPGGVELCDDLDNDCNGLVDDDPLPPGEVDGLVFLDPDTLAWTALPEAVSYNLYRGTFAGTGWVFDHLCLEARIPATSTSDNGIPGYGYYYLLTAVDACDGEGSPGNGSSGPQRPMPISCP